MGSLHHFLGIEISHFDSGVLSNKWKFILDFLKEYDYLDVSSFDLFSDLNVKLKVGDLHLSPTDFKNLVGTVISYLYKT